MRQNIETKQLTDKCKVRADLREESLAPPVWRGKKTRWVSGSGAYPYRWVTTYRSFQIFYRRQWWYAESTDWEFI